MSTDDTNLKAEIVDTDANDGEKISDDNSDQNPRSPERKPENIKELTIKNLDTGEEFVIGENDPDFEFNTFEITCRPIDAEVEAEFENEHDGDENEKVQKRDKSIITSEDKVEAEKQAERISWLKVLYRYIFQNKQKGDSSTEPEATIPSGSTDTIVNRASDSASQKHKTPFTKLSSFKFKRELGRGAFGRVMLAEAKTDSKLYALKIISKSNMRTSDKRQAKAERDILYAMALKSPHPFTSGLKFAFQSENNLYLGMDFIPGGNLRELIKRMKFLPEDWVRFYAAELVLAISHLHSLNVLYRDIKPHNVMIDARGHVILIDFGLSKQEISHPKGALSLVGTPDYSAPEVLKTGVQQIEVHNREKKKMQQYPRSRPGASPGTQKILSKMGYGKAADWWSLGIMIYEMLAGIPAFRGADLRQTYQKILYADLEFNPQERFSPEARVLLTGLITRDPAARLGAWENPPMDIMRSSFFRGISWENILARVQDGPMLPQQVQYGSTPAQETTSIAGAGTPNGKVAEDGFEGFNTTHKSTASSQIASAVKGPAAGLTTSPTPSGFGFFKGSTGKKPQLLPQSTMGDDDSDDDDGDEDSVNELLNLRDSILIPSNKGDKDNRLADWSFIDAELLMGSMKKKKSGKWTPAASELMEEDPSRLEAPSIMQESGIMSSVPTATTTTTTTTTIAAREGNNEALEKGEATTEKETTTNLVSEPPKSSEYSSNDNINIGPDDSPSVVVAAVPSATSSTTAEH